MNAVAFVRIDNRLIHGQIIETWLPYTGATQVVVANDELANDILQQEIMSLAIPQTVASSFVSVESVHDLFNNDVDHTDLIILFSIVLMQNEPMKLDLIFQFST